MYISTFLLCYMGCFMPTGTVCVHPYLCYVSRVTAAMCKFIGASIWQDLHFAPVKILVTASRWYLQLNVRFEPRLTT